MYYDPRRAYRMGQLEKRPAGAADFPLERLIHREHQRYSFQLHGCWFEDAAKYKYINTPYRENVKPGCLALCGSAVSGRCHHVSWRGICRVLQPTRNVVFLEFTMHRERQ